MMAGTAPRDSRRRCSQRARRSSDREPEVDDVAVPHDVLLALEAQLPRLAALRLAPVADELVERHHLGADEAALDVAVDLAGGLERRRAAADRPGAALVLARGEEADEVEQVVARADEAVARALGESEVVEEGFPIGGLEPRDLGLEPGREHQGLRAYGAPPRRDVRGQRRGRLRLGHVEHDEERPEREKREAGELRALLDGEAEGAERPSSLQLGHDALEQRLLPLVALLLPQALEP